MSKTKRKEIDYHKLNRQLKKELERKVNTKQSEHGLIQEARLASAIKAWRS